MLPLSLLKTAQGHPMLIELKNGDTYNGRLVSCNMFMNINLKEVICTSKDGDRFWKLPECYIRGNSIKYLRIPDEVVTMVSEEDQRDKRMQGRGRGGRMAGKMGRGGGRGDDAGRGGRGSYGGRDGGRGGGRGNYTGRGGRSDRGGRGQGRGSY